MARYILGVDVGGTFTDFVAFDRESGAVSAWKNLSEADDPTAGIETGIARLDDAGDIEVLRLGTTVATNAMLERSGARVAYVTTRGFRDIPFLQRGNRAGHYDSGWIKPKPLVLRRHCFEIDERVSAAGEVLTAPRREDVDAVAAAILAAGEIEAVAVNLLFSYVEPAHERLVRTWLQEKLGDIPVSISSDVLPKWKEYERASTVIADAYLKPVVQNYLADMRERLAARGVARPPVLIRSNGGEMSMEGAAAEPIQLTLSGPTGGVVAARSIAAELALDRLVTLDMGGTSTDCATVVDGDMSFTTMFEIEFGVPIQIPMVDIRTIGAGGGSIAWVDRGGMLRVGPRSAGARPGPAAYGFGGTEPTVTDANLVLGRIDAANFLGGDMAVDLAAARQALAALGQHIGLDTEATALAILKIVNNNMVGALRAVLIERGHDPRDFALLAFGGAGPLHLGDLMRDAGIPRGVVPRFPGQFSAFGFTLADARIDLEQTVQMTSARFEPARASQIVVDLRQRAEARLRDQGYDSEPQVMRSLELRYLGQNYELELPFDFETFDDAALAGVWDGFHALHEARFGFAIRGDVIEVITIRVTVVAPTAKPDFPALAAAAGTPRPRTTRAVWFDDGPRDTAVFARDALGAGDRVEGPALIEEAASVTVVGPGQAAGVAPHGELLIEHA